MKKEAMKLKAPEDLSSTGRELLRRWSRCTWPGGAVLEVPEGRAEDAEELVSFDLLQRKYTRKEPIVLQRMTVEGAALARALRLRTLYGKSEKKS